jgi:hypothetical protein
MIGFRGWYGLYWGFRSRIVDEFIVFVSIYVENNQVRIKVLN